MRTAASWFLPLLLACATPAEPRAPRRDVPSAATNAPGDTAAARVSTSASTTAPEASVAPPAAGTPDARCTADTDCVVTTFVSCCHVCGHGDPRADLRQRVEAAMGRCASMDCGERPPVSCSAPRSDEGARAVCREGACALVFDPLPTPRAPLEQPVESPFDDLAAGCRVDDDCAMSSFGGCCSACSCPEPHAIRKANVAREREPCLVVECPNVGEKLCEACPPVPRSRPACRGSRCVLVAN
ncbi:MAG: hypothetical protein FJ096_06825 [Deltaproteobacteria bacterium]|nr:hypothetical protein [Deltaproteobacteria bacterium]